MIEGSSTTNYFLNKKLSFLWISYLNLTNHIFPINTLVESCLLSIYSNLLYKKMEMISNKMDQFVLSFTSILSSQPLWKKIRYIICQLNPANFWAQISPQKYPFDMFPCTYSSPLGRVDNLVIIPETRLNKPLQLCNQYDTLNVPWEYNKDVVKR